MNPNFSIKNYALFRRNNFILFFCFIGLIIILGNAGGRADTANAGETGAPKKSGPAEGVCGDCHNGGSYGTIGISIEIRDKITNQVVMQYIAGKTYEIDVSVNHANGNPPAFGFQMTVIDGAKNNVGTYQNVSSNTQISTTMGGNSRTYVEQWEPSTSNLFQTDWVAPSAGTGNITFYAAGNAVNLSGNTAADNAGNTSLSLTEGSPCPTLSLSTLITNATSGINNGSINLSVSEGQSPYTYSWTNNAGNSQDPSGLAPGSYTVTVTDATGCTGVTSATVGVNCPNSLNLSFTKTDATSGISNGSIDLTVGAGKSPYTYSWTNGAGNNQDPSNLASGSYTVTVTDANNCSDQLTVTISVVCPNSLNLSATVINELSGAGNGSINLSVGGGQSPYTYSWTNNAGSGQDPANLTAGTYSVTVTDANNCTDNLTKIVGVNCVNAINLSGSITQPSSGQTNGAINLTVTGGQSPFTYSWTNGAGSNQDPSGLGAGTYEVTVTDANDCIATKSFVLTTACPSNLGLSTTVTNATSGLNNGSINLSISGGQSPYTYAWTNGAGTNQDPSGLSAGSYSVTVTDASGCTDVITVTVGINCPNNLSLSATSVDATSGINNGSINLTVGAGKSPYTYAWTNGGGTNQDPSNLSSGSYTVTVTDANNCTDQLTTTINIVCPNNLGLSATVVNELSGANNGSINLSVTAGKAPYTYSWTNGGGTSQDPSNLSTGTYVVTVTDANNCVDNLSVNVNVNCTNAISLSGTISHPSSGQSNGAINLSVNGGQSPYTYSWSNGAGSNQDPSGLSAGTYSVVVTDANNCTANKSFVLTSACPPNLGLSTSVTNATSGLNNGAINLSVSGGQMPYTFSWTNGAGSNEDPTGLAAGSYSVTVSDANGCTDVTTAIVGINCPNSLNLSATTNDATSGLSNGSINLTVGAGKSPYTYSWTNNAGTNQDPSNLAAGNYTVTVTDANNCTDQLTATINIICPNSLGLSATKVNELSGASNGSINLTVAAGQSPYTYLWTNGAGSNQDPTNLSAGTYSVTVTDANNCTDNLSITIGVNCNNAINLTKTVQAQVSGSANGSIDLTVAGGQPPYSFNWSNGGTTEDISGLLSGVYSITVTDANNCQSNLSINLPVTCPSNLQLSAIPTHETAVNANDGSIDLTVGGGQSPYTFNWNNNGGFNEDINNLAPNTYTVTVTDANNCVDTLTVAIQPYQCPPNLGLSFTATNTISGLATGSINLTVSNGNAPYTFAWSNNESTEDISNLSNGAYFVTAEDAKGCTDTLTIFIGIDCPNSLSIQSNITNTISGQNNGSIDLSVLAGQGPYTYLWPSLNKTSQDVTNLGAGTYLVVVTDANNCIDSLENTIGINCPNNLGLTATVSHESTPNTNDGAIDLSVAGGQSPYTYLWDNNAGTNEDPQALSPGDYTVIVSDVNGCNDTLSVQINSADCPPDLGLSVSITNTSSGTNSGAIDLSVLGGQPPYQFNWSSGLPSIEDPSNLASGTYTVTVTDATGCSDNISATVNIDCPNNLNLSSVVTDATSGINNGSINLSVGVGQPPYTYAWTNGAGSIQDPSNLAAGSYTVTVTDANSCSDQLTATINITCPNSLGLSATKINELSGASNGSINLSVTAGQSPYTYSWTNGAGSNQDPSGLTAGSYTVTVTDENNCSDNLTINVGVNCTNAINLSTITQPEISGENNGSINLTVNGAQSPYTFDWSNGAGTNNINNLSSGTYTVTVTDFNNCTASISASVALVCPIAIQYNTNITSATSGNADGAIDLTILNGKSPYIFNWSDGLGNSEDVANVGSGEYSVIVTDANNCSDTLFIPVTSSCGNIDLSSIVSDETSGLSNGAINLSVQNGQLPYSFTWSNDAITEDISNLSTGIYGVTVSDANGCSATLSDTVGVICPANLSLNAVVSNATSGLLDGSIDLTISAGQSPYIVDWEDINDNIEDRINVGAGIYNVTVTDANGCMDSMAIDVSVDCPNSIIVSDTIVPNTSGENNGSISLTVQNGAAPYSFAWSNGLSNAAIQENLNDGSYIVAISDSNGCEQVFTFEVPLTCSLNLGLSTTVTPATSGLSNGALDLTVSNGEPPYQYTWSNGSNSEDISNLSIGNYIVIVEDANGCIDSISTEVIVSCGSIALDATVTNAISGNTDGAIDLNILGGESPFTYLWSNNLDAIEDQSSLAAGSYTVTVTDINNCSESLTMEVGINCPNSLLLSNSTSAATSGNVNGSIDLTVGQGANPFTYNWSNESATEDISNIASGSYTVVVVDTNNCIDSATISVGIVCPQSLELSHLITNATSGNNDGSIDLTVGSGQPPYTYAWTNGAGIVEDPNNLNSGLYIVTVIDFNGCIDRDSAEIGTDCGTNFNIEIVTTPATSGINNGSINLSVTGGLMPYEFSWTNNLPPTENHNNVIAGSYVVTITDANGCSTDTTIIVETICPSSLQLEGNSTPSISGATTGSASVTANSGLAPYSYNWANGSTSQEINNIPSGGYIAIVTDANSCIDSILVTVGNTCPSNFNIVSSVESAISGMDNGIISISVSGGQSPYTIEWSGGLNSLFNLNNVPAGNYTGIITDDNGCTDVVSVSIGIICPLTLNITAVVTPESVSGAGDGAIDITVNGGQSPYTYLWQIGLNTEDIDELNPGNYSVTVIDANGCSDLLNITVNSAGCPNDLDLSFTSVPELSGLENGSIDLTIGAGQSPYSYTWSNGALTEDLNNVSTGTYQVTVKDTNNCTDQINIPVDVVCPESLLTLEEITAATSGIANGNINLDVLNGQAPYAYQWSNGSINQDQFLIPGGNYQVVVTDLNGCSDNFDFQVPFNCPSNLNVTAQVVNESAIGASDGSIDINVGGGAAPYSYIWSNGSSTQDIDNLEPGNFSVLVTDANNCIDSVIITVNSASCPSNFGIEISVTNEISGLSNGSISLLPTNGTSPFSYQWNGNFGNSNTINNLNHGEYSVTITDSFGCSQFLNISVGLECPSNLGIEYTTTLDSNSNHTGSIDLSIQYGKQPYFIEWSNGIINQQDLFDLAAGTYIVNVVDANGCKDSAVISINAFNCPSTLGLLIETTNSISGDSTGTAAIVNLEGTPPFSFEWSYGVQDTFIQGGLPPGNFQLIVEDANGCSEQKTFNIGVDCPQNLGLITGQTPSVVGVNDGSLNVVANLGSEPYTYQWNNDAGNSENPTGLAPGEYSVIVTDLYGCQDSTNATIKTINPNNIQIEHLEGYLLSPNPTSNGISVLSLRFDEEVKVSCNVFNNRGVLVQAFKEINGVEFGYTIDLTQRSTNGIYFLQVSVNEEIFYMKLVKMVK